jgi:hypothetical protein
LPTRGRPRRWLITSLVAVPALISLIACSSTPPALPSQPTVQAAATQVSAAASPVVATVQAAAPTIQAAASPVTATAGALANTAIAAASPIATALASPSPSPAALGPAPIRIADASLADATPWVSLQNTGGAPVDVGGWQLQVGNQSASLPEDATIEPGTTLTLHAGDGADSDHEIYLGNAGIALVSAAQPGALVRLTDDDGQIVAQTTVPRFQ